MGKLGADIKLAGRMAAAVFLTLLRVRRTRRKMMFAVTLGTMVFAFMGFTLLDSFLTDHPILFAVFWLICAGMVFFMLLLAIYDFAAVKGEHRVRSDRELAEVLKDIERAAHDSHPEEGTPKNDPD